MQVERLSVHRRGIDLEVTRVNDDADRSAYRERHAVYGAVRHVQVLDREWAYDCGVASRDFVQLRGFEQAVLFQFFLDDGESELRSVNRDIQIRENVRNRADVVFMRVREHDGLHHAFVLLQVGGVGNYDVHAKQFLLWEHQARVDDDNFVAEAQGHHIHAEFAQSA